MKRKGEMRRREAEEEGRPHSFIKPLSIAHGLLVFIQYASCSEFYFALSPLPRDLRGFYRATACNATHGTAKAL